MDSALDLKFKRLLNEYFQNKDEKLNPIYFSQTSKPFLFKKRNLKKPKSHIIIPKDINTNKSKEKTNSSNNIIYIRLKSAYKKDNKKIIKLKPFKPINSSIKTLHKKNNCRIFNPERQLVSTDILQDKSFSKLGVGQLSINSLFNQIQDNNNNNDNKNRKSEYIKKNISDFDLNKLHNLQLTPLKEKKRSRKLTKFAMLNNLYHKYSSTLSGSIRNEKKDNFNDIYYKKDNKNNILSKDNSQIYLTHYYSNKYFNYNNIYKRNLNKPENQNVNNRIINKDNKIFIDCLLSKVDSDIKTKSIFPKNFGKTIYNLQKENSYLRIQNLDNVFSEIMKK